MLRIEAYLDSFDARTRSLSDFINGIDPKRTLSSIRLADQNARAGDFMHAHKQKRPARETEATVKEIRRKASKIAPAYN
jgi:hypothetical protein